MTDETNEGTAKTAARGAAIPAQKKARKIGGVSIGRGKGKARLRFQPKDSSRLDRVIAYLGGKGVVIGEIKSPIDTHHVLARGLPKRSVTHLLDSLLVAHDRGVLSGALGMSARTQQRLKAEPQEALSVEVSGRAWQFAETLAHASEVFGTQVAAEHWLETPAVALDGEKPLDLLSTPPGSEMVRTLLTRIEFGVYA